MGRKERFFLGLPGCSPVLGGSEGASSSGLVLRPAQRVRVRGPGRTESPLSVRARGRGCLRGRGAAGPGAEQTGGGV